MWGADTFRVKLHAEEWVRRMFERHAEMVVRGSCGNFECGWEGVFVDEERVISHDGDLFWNIFEKE